MQVAMLKPEFDPYSHAVQDDPYSHSAALPAQDPVYFNKKYGFWLLTKHEDLFHAFRDFKTFSNAKGVAREAARSANAYSYPMILSMDPPSHTQLRKIVSKILSPEHVARLEYAIPQKAKAWPEPFLAACSIDIIDNFGSCLSMSVVSRRWCIPEEDEDMIRGWTEDLIFREEGAFRISQRGINAFASMVDYFSRLTKAVKKIPFYP